MASQYSDYQTNENSDFRIMVATDNHLGYLEHDQIRGDDSFVAFEEILSLSKLYKVDFLLLGGDLFHHHNPTKKTMYFIN
jgi:double-strand break repair protein MRE11